MGIEIILFRGQPKKSNGLAQTTIPLQIEELLARDVPVLLDIAHVLPNNRLSYLTVKKVKEYHGRGK